MAVRWSADRTVAWRGGVLRPVNPGESWHDHRGSKSVNRLTCGHELALSGGPGVEQAIRHLGVIWLTWMLISS
jgi:hypothetical protein